jgi:hypothetical protein
VLTAALLLAATQAVTRVEIHSHWSGFGSSKPADVVIERRGNSYRRGWHRADPRDIERLVDALNTTDTTSATVYGVSQQWLDANAEAALTTLNESSLEKQQLFLKSFRDAALIKEVLDQHFRSVTYDDYPDVTASIAFADGHTISLHSTAQTFFMVPWNVAHDGAEDDMSFNPGVGVALARLLPRGATNQGRLAGGGFAEWLARELVSGPIAGAWNLADSKSRVGDNFVRVAERFEIVESAILNISSVDIGRADDVASWTLRLRQRGLPPNLFIGVALPFAKEHVLGLDVFLGSIDHYVQQALAVPWLAASIREHPDARVDLRFVDDRSFSAKGEQWLRKSAPSELIAQIGQSLRLSTFIEAREGNCWSRWIVLPDRRVLLWSLEAYAPADCNGAALGEPLDSVSWGPFRSANVYRLFD